MSGNADVSGHVDSAFVAVQDAFAGLVADGTETGGAVAVWVDGREVVNLWGGEASPGRPWRPDTLVNVYSTGKPLLSLAVLLLVERGVVDLDAPLARYWPEFAAGGKEDATVRHALAHAAGVMGIRTPLPAEALFDWERMAAAVAAEPAWWVPGEAVGEHAVTYGFLLGELIRRVDGRGPAAVLATELARPWGLDAGWALSPSDQRRCATLTWQAGHPEDLGDPDAAQALGNPPGVRDLAVVNGPAWRAAEVPAVNLHATARAIARCYAGLLEGGRLGDVRLLGDGLVTELTTVQARGYDRFVGEEVAWGLGVQLDDEEPWPGFGMGGIGGSVGFAVPRAGLAIAYVTARLGDFDRVDAVMDALAVSLD